VGLPKGRKENLMANTGGSATHTCFICDEEANYAHGNFYSLFWLCDKHDKKFIGEEKRLKKMIEIQALRNIKKRFLMDSMES